MDSFQTSQCVLLSVVVGVLMLILGAILYILYIFVVAPLADAIDDDKAVKAEYNVTTVFDYHSD